VLEEVDRQSIDVPSEKLCALLARWRRRAGGDLFVVEYGFQPTSKSIPSKPKLDVSTVVPSKPRIGGSIAAVVCSSST